MRKRVLTLTFTLAVLAATARAQEGETLQANEPLQVTLAEAVRIAVQENPGSQRSRVAVDQSEAEARLLRTAIFPRIDLSGALIRNSKEVSFGSDMGSFTVLPESDWNARLSLRQPIFAGRRELRAYNQAKLAVNVAEQQSEWIEDSIILQTAADYMQAVQAGQLVEVELKNLDLAKRQRDLAQTFLDAGEATRVDVLRAETSTKAAERRLTAALQQRDAALSRLQLDLGTDRPVRLSGGTAQLPPMPSQEILVAKAVAQRPEVQQAELGVRMANLEVKKQQGRYFPVITAEASMTQQKVTFPADEFSAFSLNLALPVFDSGETRARIAVAREQKRSAELLVEQLTRQTRVDVEIALLALRTAETNLALAREQLIAAEA